MNLKIFPVSYYTGAVAAFAGILVALAMFLFSYRGYKNAYGKLDRIAAITAGIAAVGVAFFPTGAPENITALSWWTPIIGVIHLISAAVLFGSFIFFSLVLFRKSDEKRRGSRPLEKRLRNIIFGICGLAMFACIVWAVIALVFDAPIFWPEALALEFFAISWLAKGCAEVTLVVVSKRVLYYGSHPWRIFSLGKNSTDWGFHQTSSRKSPRYYATKLTFSVAQFFGMRSRPAEQNLLASPVRPARSEKRTGSLTYPFEVDPLAIARFRPSLRRLTSVIEHGGTLSRNSGPPKRNPTRQKVDNPT